MFSTIFRSRFIVVTILLGIFVVLTLIMSSKSVEESSTSNVGAFLLAVTLKFKSIDQKEVFRALFTPYAEYVKQNEPKTLSYVMYESDKSESQVLIFERYVDKEAYLHLHRTSQQFLVFREKLQDMVKAELVTIEGDSYIESTSGFFSK